MDRSSFKRFLATSCAVLLLPLAAAADNASFENGQWALRNGPPQILSQLFVRTSKDRTQLDVVQYSFGKKIVRYREEEAHYLHLLLVRDDFRDFTHLHPVMKAGHFIANVALAGGHRYYIYADSYPKGIGQQVFRFNLTIGKAPQSTQTAIDASATSALVGPYKVRISTTRVVAREATTLYLHINKGGLPATDIRPYLGADAHAVAINTSNLTYLHIDPALVSSKRPAEVQVVLPPTSPHAAYKLWVEFNGGGTEYTVPFTLVAK